MTESFVQFQFQPTHAELNAIYKNLSPSFSAADLNKPIISNDGKDYTLKDFLALQRICYQIDILDNQKFPFCFSVGKKQINSGWKRITSIDLNHLLRNAIGNVNIVEKTEYFYDASNTTSTFESVTPLTIDKLEEAISDEFRKVATNLFPQCIYWKYDKAHLLPAVINADDFANQPAICVPLRSMFELAGYKEEIIQQTLIAARNQSNVAFKNLLTQVASRATAHLRSVWQDYANVKLELTRNGNLIEATVKEEQMETDFANRSEGFKRFISFILVLSARVKTGSIRDALILVDEPEISLHPSGARNLMRELIAIGEKNNVVYSTHSIFMVDKENIGRHQIVKKHLDATTISRVDTSQIVDEDVLYRAVGYSIFETLRKDNVIFEGWRDKQLFKAFLSSNSSRTDAEKLVTIGTTYAQGVKDAKHIASFLELASRGCLIISDSDAPAKQWQKTFRDQHGYGHWVTYADVIDEKYVTAEDFLTKGSVLKRANEFASKHSLRELTTSDIIEGQPLLAMLKRWVAELQLSKDENEYVLNDLKSALFSDIQGTELIEEYKLIANYISNYVFSYG